MRLRALTVAVAAAGTLALAASPASAAGNWQAVDTNSNWRCTDYVKHSVSDHVKYKTCIVINANNDAQAVLVVQNAASVAVSIGGSVASDFHSNVSCANSTLNPGFTRGCFAPTSYVGDLSVIKATGQFKLNGVNNSLDLLVYRG
nr:hypothetical protein OG284_18615 [Streptomyces sp. NBC_01177]